MGKVLRISKSDRYENQYNWQEPEFPVEIEKVDKFK